MFLRFFPRLRMHNLGRLFCGVLSLAFGFSAIPAPAAVLPYMQAPTQMIAPSPAFEMPYLVGMKFSSDNIFRFSFILNRGTSVVNTAVANAELDKIGKYFLAALALPAKDLWVNLSPYEQKRICTPELGQTDLGKDMLGEDYVLKQFSSSMTFPDSQLGKKFWDGVYAKVREKMGKTNISVDSFNKVWIVPGEIKMVESDSTAVIQKATLKVMTQQDYLAMKNNASEATAKDNSETAKISAQVMKEVVIPIIEKEVNTGKSFATLRQLNRAVIMAAWYKAKLKNTVLGQALFNQKKIKGADVNDPTIKDQIYKEYVTAFEKCVYKVVRHERDADGKALRRQYFSGGAREGVLQGAPVAQDDGTVASPLTEARTGATVGSVARVDQPAVEAAARNAGGTATDDVEVVPVNEAGQPIADTATAPVPAAATPVEPGTSSVEAAKDIGVRNINNVTQARTQRGDSPETTSAVATDLLGQLDAAGINTGFAAGAVNPAALAAVHQAHEASGLANKIRILKKAGFSEEAIATFLKSTTCGKIANVTLENGVFKDKEGNAIPVRYSGDGDDAIAVHATTGDILVNAQGQTFRKGGIDFSELENGKIKMTLIRGGVKFSGEKAAQMLINGEVTGAILKQLNP